jgi:hypothetical protein
MLIKKGPIYTSIACSVVWAIMATPIDQLLVGTLLVYLATFAISDMRA